MENTDLDGIKVTKRNLSELKHTKLNPVKHSKRNKKTVQDSLEEVGFGRSIVISGEDEIICGNNTTEQMRELGYDTFIEIEVPNNHTAVAIKRSDLDPDQQQRMALLDNASAKLNNWDAESLAQLKLNGISLEGALTEKEFDKLVLNKTNIDPTSPENNYGGGTDKFFLIIECTEESVQNDLFNYLTEEGYSVTKYSGNKK